ncbi:MAG: polysaccharide deacetylase family protein [Lentisphaeria bacterium]|jgi:peptidoglycan/xylan/chitin deacetylase (PgdA/CDA1 family)
MMAVRMQYFPGGRNKALTFSYDDGPAGDRRLVELFNRYGLRGTFHLNSANMGRGDKISAAEAATLYAGHEIAAHTCTHPYPKQLSNEELLQELLEDRRALEAITGAPVRGLSYPYGHFDDRIVSLVRACGYAYSRTTKADAGFTLPDDPYRWATTGHHKHDILQKTKDFLAMWDDKRRGPSLFYVWGHSFEFDRENNWSLMEDFAKQIAGRDDIWYATNIEIIDYLAAMRRLQYTVDGKVVCNPSAQSVWVAAQGEAREVPAGGCLRL